MKCLILAGIAIMTLFHASATSAPASTNLIVGKWRHLTMVQTADGKVVRVHRSHGEATVEFKSDGTWTSTDPSNSNSGTYRLLDEGRLESTILKSGLPVQVGWFSVKKIRVDRSSLELVTTYDENGMKAFAKRADGSRPKEMAVTSTFEREKKSGLAP